MSTNLKLTTIVLLLTAAFICCFHHAFVVVEATSSQCRGPQVGASERLSFQKRRSVVVLSNEQQQQQELSTTSSSSESSPSGNSNSAIESSSIPISPEAKYFIKKAPSTYQITGPLNEKLSKRSETFQGKEQTNCIACRMDCMRKVHPQVGSFFESCREQYYYYGCKKRQPCYELSDGDFVLEMAIGICLEKNGCIMKRSFLKENEVEQ